MSLFFYKGKLALENGHLRYMFLQWLGLVISAVIYMLLVYINHINLLRLVNPLRTVVQATGFILLPILWHVFVLNPKNKLKSLLLLIGTKRGRTKNYILRSLLEGLGIYVIVMLPLFYLGRLWWNSELFTWFDFRQNPRILIYVIGAFVSVSSVELVTKGYLMTSSLEKNLPKPIIFFNAMLAWILGHIVEYLWLSVYVPPWYAIFVLLLAGLLSVMSVFNTENIIGVTVGHIAINVIIIVIMSVF